jgi:hypothetical protein
MRIKNYSVSGPIPGTKWMGKIEESGKGKRLNARRSLTTQNKYDASKQAKRRNQYAV